MLEDFYFVTKVYNLLEQKKFFYKYRKNIVFLLQSINKKHVTGQTTWSILKFNEYKRITKKIRRTAA